MIQSQKVTNFVSDDSLEVQFVGCNVVAIRAELVRRIKHNIGVHDLAWKPDRLSKFVANGSPIRPIDRRESQDSG